MSREKTTRPRRLDEKGVRKEGIVTNAVGVFFDVTKHARNNLLECRRCCRNFGTTTIHLLHIYSHRCPHEPSGYGASGDEVVPGAAETGGDGCGRAAQKDKPPKGIRNFSARNGEALEIAQKQRQEKARRGSAINKYACTEAG